MSLDLKQRSQKRMRLLVAGLVGVVVLLVGVLVGVLASGGDGSDTVKSDSAGPSKKGDSAQPSEAPSDAQNDGTFHDPASWVVLPKGKAKKNSLPIGFPHTEKGAVAAAVEYNRATWSLEEDPIRSAIETYFLPKERETALAVAPQAANAARQMAGIPAEGPLPDGAEMNGWPIGVQWESLTDQRVRVYILTRVTFRASGEEKQRTRVEAAPIDASWTGGDWKVRLPEKVDPSQIPDPADLGSKKFTQEGWRAIQEGDRR